jgi:hypothetical protein
MFQQHQSFINGKKLIWDVSRLIELSKDFPVRDVTISSIANFDDVCWFNSDEKPTCRAVAEHAKRIMAVDLSYPIILSQAGNVMDGLHRVARAFLDGNVYVKAVRFTIDPEPDQIEDV